MGELGVAWGRGVGVDVCSTFVLRFNLTRDLSRSVPMVIRSPPDPYLIIFTISKTLFSCIELPIELPIELTAYWLYYSKWGCLLDLPTCAFQPKH